MKWFKKKTSCQEKTCHDCAFRKSESCNRKNENIFICESFKQLCQDCSFKKATYVYGEILVCDDCMLSRMDRGMGIAIIKPFKQKGE